MSGNFVMFPSIGKILPIASVGSIDAIVMTTVKIEFIEPHSTHDPLAMRFVEIAELQFNMQSAEVKKKSEDDSLLIYSKHLEERSSVIELQQSELIAAMEKEDLSKLEKRLKKVMLFISKKELIARQETEETVTQFPNLTNSIGNTKISITEDDRLDFEKTMRSLKKQIASLAPAEPTYYHFSSYVSKLQKDNVDSLDITALQNKIKDITHEVMIVM